VRFTPFAPLSLDNFVRAWEAAPFADHDATHLEYFSPELRTAQVHAIREIYRASILRARQLHQEGKGPVREGRPLRPSSRVTSTCLRTTH
jgi:hypothetical protein